MKHILCFGEALIDFHAIEAATDAPASYLPHAGGAPANVAVALAKLGSQVAFIGMLSTDPFGDFLHDSLKRAGVDVRHVRRTSAANTALAFVSLDAQGERSFTFYRPPAADLLFSVDDFDDDAFAKACLFHACSNSLTEEGIAGSTMDGMRRAHQAGALVSFDMNLRPALWPRQEEPMPRLWQALQQADVVKLSAEELDYVAAPMGGEDYACEKLWQGRTRLLIVTDASAPIRWFTPGEKGTMPAFKVRNVDSTGAGDAFVGGLLCGLAQAQATPDTLDALCRDADRRRGLLRFAAACGALAVMQTGSFDAMPTAEAARAFLESRA